MTLPLLKSHLRVDGTSEDTLLTFYLAAACQKADTYCQNPFLDYDGVTELDIPADLDLWVMEAVSKFYNNRTGGLQKEEVVDLGSVQYAKLDNIDVNYDKIKCYRINPGFSSYYF